ncbi:hypothetical protein H0H81_010774 [Sphagnurus paluster]|uniref:CoA-transferase family III n=1 Tax=Sphagnurus paluster TaxID=117069 RepID=A0A9P7FQS6_9AGAR|nr:hypothetical protein H0H81_010774 [Sphagnurus paluster]
MNPTAHATAASIWRSLNLPASALTQLHLPPSPDPDAAINSSFRLGAAAQASIGASALAIAQFHFLRTGETQRVSVDARHAVISFHSETWYNVDGALPSGGVCDDIAGLYRTADGHIRIHTNFPHHRAGILRLLSLPSTPAPNRADVSHALSTQSASAFEAAAASAGMCAFALRTAAEWDAHPQAHALRGAAPVEVRRIGDAPKRIIPGGGAGIERALQGIRVLDLSRVLAGPVAGRTLAAHGADVLRIVSPSLPALPLLDTETSLGKRTAHLDLTSTSACGTLAALTRDADVFLQAYRPGALAAKGFGVDEVARLRPGIVYAELCAWGWEGPWKDLRGFDSLVQTATGFNIDEGEAYRAFTGSETPASPRALPMQALDHAAGYLLACGIAAALCNTITEGGTWHLRVSLAAAGAWLRSLGRADIGLGHAFPPRQAPPHPEIAALCGTWVMHDREGEGKLRGRAKDITAVRQAGVLSLTPARAGEVLGMDEPKWL